MTAGGDGSATTALPAPPQRRPRARRDVAGADPAGTTADLSTVGAPLSRTAHDGTAGPRDTAGPPATVAVTTPPRRRGRGPGPWWAASLRILALLLVGFVVAVALVGPARHARDQEVAHAALRTSLAEATAPVGQTDAQGRLLALGTPVAHLRIPRLGVEEVVGEGTTSGVLRSGPGHLRSTVLPGQPGTSVVLGRQAAYGGPFGGLADLRRGDHVVVTTGQGEHRYRVTGLRRAGDALPPALAAGEGRLTLVTADGVPFAPDGVLRVDAELVSPVQPAPPRVLGAAGLLPAEAPLAGDGDAWVEVVLLGQALLLAVVAVTWARLRWGRAQSWVVGVPLLGALGLALADQVARLLPNLL